MDTLECASPAKRSITILHAPILIRFFISKSSKIKHNSRAIHLRTHVLRDLALKGGDRDETKEPHCRSQRSFQVEPRSISLHILTISSRNSDSPCFIQSRHITESATKMASSANNEQDLLPDQTEGFKVGEKKTIDEYNKLGTFRL